RAAIARLRNVDLLLGGARPDGVRRRPPARRRRRPDGEIAGDRRALRLDGRLRPEDARVRRGGARNVLRLPVVPPDVELVPAGAVGLAVDRRELLVVSGGIVD